jgi:WD40 repeat protein
MTVLTARVCVFWTALLASTALAAPQTDKHGDPLPDGAIARFGSTRLRHPAPIEALAYSPDGKLIASACPEFRHKSIRLWNAATGQLVRDIGDGRHGAVCLAFSPDSKILAGGSDGRVLLWDVESGMELANLDAINAAERAEYEKMRAFGGGFGRPETYNVCFSVDGNSLAHATHKRVVIWDVETRKARVTLEVTKTTVTIEGGVPVLTLESLKPTPHFLAYTPDGKTLISADRGRAVQCWNAETGKLIREYNVEGPERYVNIFGLATAPDSKHAALKLKENLVVIEIESGKVVWREKMPGDHDEPVAFSRDSLLAFGGRIGVRIFDWKANKLLANITEGSGNFYLRRVCFAPDGKQLAWSGSDGVIRVWDVAASKEVLPPTGHRGWIDHFALRPDGKQIATIDYHRTLRTWDTAKQEVIRTVKVDPPLYPHCIAFPHEGGVFVIGDSRSHVAVIDVRGEKKPATTTGPVADRCLYALSLDGHMALATDPWWKVTHLVFDRGSKWVKFTGNDLKCHDSRFSADGKYIWVSGWDYLAYVDVANAKERWRVNGYANPNFVRGSLACSADGRYVAAGITSLSADPRESVIRIWETGRGYEWKVMKSPHAVVTAAAFSSDNRFLVTASMTPDGGLPPFNTSLTRTISLWETSSGTELARFTGHDSTIRALAFAPDSRTFYSSSNDGTVLQWDWLGLANAETPKINEQTWSDLASRDRAKIYRATQQFTALPKESTAFLSERLQPPPPAITRETLARLLRDLDSDNFKTRDAATRELDALGEQVVGPLEDALKHSPSVEAEKRILLLLKERGAKLYPDDELRRMRAVLVLERIGGPDATRLLETMAASKADVISVRHARAALERLNALNR